MSFERLRTALASRPPGTATIDRIAPEHLPPGGFTPAAALVPLHEKDGEPHLVLTRRPNHMRLHPGQLSVPGGHIEPGEEPLQAALREANEEIGLATADVDVLGRLSETIVLASGYRLTPWVASVPYPYPYVPAPDEVDAIIHVPLAALDRPGAHRAVPRRAYGMDLDVHYFAIDGETLWGATARIVWELLSVWRGA
ncbi:MAG TPA: CoA pyrophosphatase [Anaeromyxobacteraceae bacterium]|nr:CoA pyrophosphatase [Anaeromyxobacteraceae bacterium]